jgi:hypothetical protein
MRKALMPLVASLALAGGMTGLLIATNAQAQQAVAGLLTTPAQAKKPMLLAMNQQDQLGADDTAAPPSEGGPDMMAERGARRAQMCQDMYAHKVGELAFLETKLSLTPAQTPLFARWKQVSLDTARSHSQTCADRPMRKAGERPTILDRLSREETMLKSRLSDIQAERPALSALYAALTPQQQEEFGHGGMGRMGRMGPPRMMGGMMDHHGPMGRGPDGVPPPPPPPAQ